MRSMKVVSLVEHMYSVWGHVGPTIVHSSLRISSLMTTLSAEKSSFGLKEILVVGQKCGAYGRKPNEVKVDAINQMKDCESVSEVRRFLGACIFFRI